MGGDWFCPFRVGGCFGSSLINSGRALALSHVTHSCHFVSRRSLAGSLCYLLSLAFRAVSSSISVIPPLTPLSSLLSLVYPPPLPFLLLSSPLLSSSLPLPLACQMMVFISSLCKTQVWVVLERIKKQANTILMCSVHRPIVSI